MFYFKENYILLRFQRGSNIFPGGPLVSRGEGVQMLISIETYTTFDFPKGVVRTTYPPSGSAQGFGTHRIFISKRFYMYSAPLLTLPAKLEV